MVLGRVARKLLLSVPIRNIYTTVRSLRYLWRGLRCVLNKKLEVEVLDALSIGVSILRSDFGTAGSVMFLLKLGELLEEWTRKKSLCDLARCMSLNVDRVWLRTGQPEVLPEDKARFVEQEKAAGRKVIMIGEGINDSPALSTSDVGIAISDGAAIAREIADITIAADDLFELATLREISNALLGRINGNYRFVLGFNGSLIALGALGVLPPATSALLHNISTLGINVRSMTNLLK